MRIVANAGGLNPAGLATAVRSLAERLGLNVRVAHVEGDDLVARADELGFGTPLAANAYLGAWGIVDCLNGGADVVVTGRVTDASVIVGPAAAHLGWGRTDYDALAAVAAGHVIECGIQATGGNYSFFTEVADLTYAGFPLAEIHADGSSVITKHPGTGGQVSVDTVTAQLLYEITGARYANPDVTLRVDSIRLSDDGADRVRIDGVVGEPPPPTLKVSLNSVAVPQRDDVRAHRPGHRGQGRVVQRQLEAALSVKPAELEDARAHRPSRRRHRGGGQRAAALRGAWIPANVGRHSPRPQSNSRWPAIPDSMSPRRLARARSTASSRPATSMPPRSARRRARRRQAHRGRRPPPTPANWRPSTCRRCPNRCRRTDVARTVGPDRRRAQRRQGRQRQRRGVGAHRRAVALARAHADRREGANYCRRQPICRSPATCCPTCGR